MTRGHVYLDDMAHYDAMDRVWKEFFLKAPPARAVLGVYKLPTDLAVEINAVAFRDLTRTRRVAPAGSPQNLSWSPGVMAGNRLYLGFVGTDPATGRIPEDPDAQVQTALDNMKHTLAAAAMDFRHVVFVNPYLTNGASRRMNGNGGSAGAADDAEPARRAGGGGVGALERRCHQRVPG